MFYKVKSDLAFLSKLISDFFDPVRENEITSRLSIINKEENEITGWETWLQVEFYLYLMTRKDCVKDVIREYSYNLDSRTSYVQRSGKKVCRIDIEICKKNAKANEKWLPLEIKQHKSGSSCIRSMLADYEKYEAIKPSEKIRGNFRYPFFFGIFKTTEEDKLEKILSSNNIDFFEYKEIPNTGYAFIIF